MNPVLRHIRYFLIGAAGGALGLIMGEVFVGLPDGVVAELSPKA